jgi:excisionase family DNA binding protein
MDDRLLTILQTARQFNLTTGLLYTAVARGELAAIRFRPRGRIRVRETDVRGWIEGHASGARLLNLPRLIRPLERPSPAASDIESLLPPKAFRRFAG